LDASRVAVVVAGSIVLLTGRIASLGWLFETPSLLSGDGVLVIERVAIVLIGAGGLFP
jgi:hypothetical protein